MVGLPHSTIEDDFKTIALNAACRVSFANAFIYQPYPRTAVGEMVRREGLMDGSIDDISLSAWDTSVLKFSPSHKRQIENLQKLFALAVEFPFLVPLVKLLIGLPKNPVFWLLHKLWKGYAIKRRIHPVHLSLGEMIGIVRRYMQFD